MERDLLCKEGIAVSEIPVDVHVVASLDEEAGELHVHLRYACVQSHGVIDECNAHSQTVGAARATS